jgi:ParB family chromosome partitioning protein
VLREIPLRDLRPNPTQPRTHFEGIQALAASLKAEGQLTPLLVRPVDGYYEIVHGERRWRAAKLAGLNSLRAEVREIPDQQVFRLSLIENVQRHDLTAIDEAKAYERLQEDGMTQTEIGQLIGKTQGYVMQRLSLLRLPEDLQAKINTRVLSATIGRHLAAVRSEEVQRQLAEHAIEMGMSVREFQRMRWKVEARHRRELEELSVREKVERWPELEKYAEAIERGEVVVNVEDDEPRLKPTNVAESFRGQAFHWPRYSGVECELEGDAPLFAEDEWEEWLAFDEEAALAALDIPDGMQWCWETPEPHDPNCLLLRRDYDCDYGGFIAECCHGPGPVFVRRSWGEWRTVTFNDGGGGRESRRFFAYDYYTATLVEFAFETADPDLFSEQDLAELTLWRVQPVDMQWARARRRTVSRQDIIRALMTDLDRLQNVEQLTPQQIEQRAIEWLQDYTPANPYQFREGRCTYPRLPDGGLDHELYQKLFGE